MRARVSSHGCHANNHGLVNTVAAAAVASAAYVLCIVLGYINIIYIYICMDVVMVKSSKHQH